MVVPLHAELLQLRRRADATMVVICNLVVSTLYEPYTDGWQEPQPEAEASHAHRHRCRNQPHPNQHVVGEVGNNFRPPLPFASCVVVVVVMVSVQCKTKNNVDRWYPKDIQKPFGCQRYVNHLLDTKDTKTFWIQDQDKKTFWIVAYLSYHSTVLTITKANGYSRWRVSSRHLIRTDGQEFPVCHSSGVGVEG